MGCRGFEGALESKLRPFLAVFEGVLVGVDSIVTDGNLIKYENEIRQSK